VTGPAAPAPAAPPRASGWLVASLLLTGVSVTGLLGPLGPFAAGVLALLGHRQARASGGAVRGPRLALAAMTAALAVLALQAWTVVRTAPAGAAWARIRERALLVDGNLRRGTPEGAWELLSEEARAAGGREAFVADLSAALAALGPLESLGDAREAGGEWDRTASFGEDAGADLRLGIAFDARFARGPGRVELTVRVRRAGRAVEGSLEALRVVPGAAAVPR
jgi:hypothetical protein